MGELQGTQSTGHLEELVELYRGTWRVLVPGWIAGSHTTGSLPAVVHKDTGIVNVLDSAYAHQSMQQPHGGEHIEVEVYASREEAPAWAQDELARQQESSEDRLARLRALIGAANEAALETDPKPSVAPPLSSIVLVHDGDDVRCAGVPNPATVEYYDLHRDVFSRNTGILETDLLAQKRAILFGCGSVGSLVALELARAGVGNFLLVDADVLEYHNVCRHQCGISDVGRHKVDALTDRIHDINPAATVESFCGTAETMPKCIADAWFIPGEALAFGCADNRDADVYVNGLCVMAGVPFLSIGFWERAFAGELFYWLPGQNMPCYKCALGASALSGRVEANHHIYTTQEDLAAVNFEPGISVDINFVTIVGVKLALDILNIDDPAFTQRLLPSFNQYTLVCNTNNPTVGGPMAEIFSYPLQVTTSLQVSHGNACPPCEYERDGRA